MEITARDSPFSFDLILLRHISMIPVGNYLIERIGNAYGLTNFFIALICIMSSLMEGGTSLFSLLETNMD